MSGIRRTPKWSSAQREAFKATHAKKASGRSRLTDARIELGWSLNEYSARCGVRQAQLGAIERGDRSPTREDGEWRLDVRAAADAVGFTCEELWPEHAPKAPRLYTPEVPTPEEVYGNAEMRAALADALARLPAAQSAVILRRFGFVGEPMRCAEIGAELGFSREWVRVVETRAMESLAKMMEGLHA